MSNNITALKLPILYSFRRCPYAIRARMALKLAKVAVELREVSLSDKPQSMLDVSPKGTVPVLVLQNDTVIDESLDIVSWCAVQLDDESISNWDPEHPLIQENDSDFKYYLDRYKYADRYPDKSIEAHRQLCFPFLMQLEAALHHQQFLLDKDSPSLVDLAIMPFVGQFAKVDQAWFENSQFSYVNRWLNDWLSSDVFKDVMVNHAPWQPGDEPKYLNS